VWARLAANVPREKLEKITEVAALADLSRLANEILDGKIRGRVVIDVNAG
jgi:acrylyl-CoA reductase (NADPH)